jgi:hypothetical protein
LALCELGENSVRVNESIRRSLEHLASLERRIATSAAEKKVELGLVLRKRDPIQRNWSIGSTALTLATVLTCRSRLPHTYNTLITRLARTVLGQQRPDGGFHHRINGATGQPAKHIGGRLYVDGQAVLALVLLEKDVRNNSRSGFASHGNIQNAVDKAMTFFGEGYWDHFAGQFFFIEENWHCIAASAALGHHRHERYERLCLDYLRFKARFIHDGTTGSAEDYRGGWGFSNLVPPHNTATAGFGEALAAGIKVMRARGMETKQEEILMKEAMGFLIRNQWHAETCFSCSPKANVNGGFSEHMVSAPIRIDYVQHAWAALGHGSRALNTAWSDAFPTEMNIGQAPLQDPL